VTAQTITLRRVPDRVELREATGSIVKPVGPAFGVTRAGAALFPGVAVVGARTPPRRAEPRADNGLN
jgi:hypothetical protein